MFVKAFPHTKKIYAQFRAVAKVVLLVFLRHSRPLKKPLVRKSGLKKAFETTLEAALLCKEGSLLIPLWNPGVSNLSY